MIAITLPRIAGATIRGRKNAATTISRIEQFRKNADPNGKSFRIVAITNTINATNEGPRAGPAAITNGIQYLQDTIRETSRTVQIWLP